MEELKAAAKEKLEAINGEVKDVFAWLKEKKEELVNKQASLPFASLPLQSPPLQDEVEVAEDAEEAAGDSAEASEAAEGEEVGMTMNGSVREASLT